MVVAIVTAMPSVTHADVLCVMVMDVAIAMAVIPSMTAYTMPGVCSTIGSIEYGTPVVEIVAVWIAGIDAKVPESVSPVQWTIEIGGGTESTQLPIQKDIA